jgi:RecA/RadA recombinase
VTSASLGDVVDSARRRGFVGRRAELASFDEALTGRSARRGLLVYGPGGIGKTMLLMEMRARAQAAGRSAALLDGREIDPSPDGLRTALDDSAGAEVLLIDGYEQLAPIDRWIRGEFIPSRPADHVVVLAGRDPPAPAWRTDPGWRQVLAIHRLDHLDDTDAADLLSRAGVAEQAWPRLVRLGRGHPLALALLADAANTGTVPERLADVPDLVSALLESQLHEAPSDAHTVGLATCAKAWLTTEDLLRETVGADAAPAVWAWLRDRPFVVSRPRGLTPHDLTRDILDAEFERRSPDRYRSLHRVIHDHVLAGMRSATGIDQQLLAQHLLYLHRHSPLTAVFWELRAKGSAAVLPARPEEYAHLVSIVDRDLGGGQAEIAERWFADQPEHAWVVRTDGGVAGFVYHVFWPSGSTMAERDPVVRAILEFVAKAAPLRPGEQVSIGRFWADARDRQRGPYAVLAGSISSIIEWTTQPLAWSFVVLVDPEYWAAYFDYLGFRALLEIDAGGVRHVVYGNDWRRFPADAWLELMGEREHAGGTGPPPESMLRPPPLDRASFGAAVRSALQQLSRPDQLAENPLVGTSLGGTPAEVRASVEEAVRRLSDEPKGDQLYSVLNRTYLRAAPTQEAAAEALGQPFSTYRRYLAKAIEQLTEVLWAAEIGTIELRPKVGTN